VSASASGLRGGRGLVEGGGSRAAGGAGGVSALRVGITPRGAAIGIGIAGLATGGEKSRECGEREDEKTTHASSYQRLRRPFSVRAKGGPEAGTASWAAVDERQVGVRGLRGVAITRPA